MSTAAILERPENSHPRRVTKDEFYRLVEAGHFDGTRVELIGGEILTMAAQSNRHGAAVTLTARALDRIFATGFWVRAQMTLDLLPNSMPDPDLAVVVGDPANPSNDLPTTALLIVEVSDSTLRTDRTTKAGLYAASGIADYWILNLQDNVLEVRRDPRPDTTEPFGYSSGSLSTLRPGEFATPLAAPTARIAVAELLPG